MDHFTPDLTPCVPQAGTGAPDDSPFYPKGAIEEKSLSPKSMATPSLEDSSETLIHNVVLYNIPPEARWNDIKGLLMNYIPDSTLLHISIFPHLSYAIVSLCDRKSADILFDELEGYEWNNHVLSTSWDLESDSNQSSAQSNNMKMNPNVPVFVPMAYPSCQENYPPMPMEMYPVPVPGYGYPAPRHKFQYGSGHSFPPQMMGYFGPFPQGQPYYTTPPQYLSPRPPIPQLSHLPIPPPQQPQIYRSGSFNNSTSSSISSPMFSYRSGPSYSQGSPTVSARQLTSLRQYPYQSIMDFNSPHSSRNSSITHPSGAGQSSSSSSGAQSVDRHRLFVGNIPYETSWMDLKDYLREAGSIIRVEIPEQSPGVSRGFAIATFESEDDAARAIQLFDRKDFMGRELMVRYDRFPKKNGSSASVLPFEDDDNDVMKSKETTTKDVDKDDQEGMKRYIPRLMPVPTQENDFDDKKFADEARSLVESLSLVDH